MRALITILVCLVAFSGAKTTFAADIPIPPACQATTSTKTAYKSGISQGKALVDRAWLSVANCDRLETFTDIVIKNVENYALPTVSSAYNICRYTGVYDGVYQELDVTWNTCNGECCEEGSVIGDLSAKLYCKLSILLGGMVEPDEFVRRPVFLCGFAFEMCCDADFFGTSINYSGKDSTGELQACQPYTDGEYFTVWDETRVLQCAYTPPDPIWETKVFGSP